MPGQDPNFTYRKPVELALQLVDQLRQAWSGLPADARVEIGGLLEQVRAQLVQAAGDASADTSTAVFQGGRLRAVALNRFLYGCESSAAIPVELKAGLGKAHTGGGFTITITKQEARKIVDAIDFVISPPRASDGGPLAAPPENFADPLGRTQKLTKWFDQHWEAISIETENAVAKAMIRLGQALESAQSESDAEAAAQEFLRQIKASAAAYEQVASSVVYRSLGGGTGSGAGADNVQRILVTLQQHPTVGPALQVEDRSAKSAPPPAQAAESLSFGLPDSVAADTGLAPSSTTVSFHTSVDFPAEVTVFDKRIPLIVQLTLEAPPDTQVDATVTVEFTTPEEVEQVLVVCDAQGFEHEKDVNTRLIEVYKSSDSQLAVFLLTPKKDVEPGAKRISLDFYHRDRPAGNAVFETLIKDRPPLEKPNEKATRVTLFGIEQRFILETPVADTPDFVLRVTLGVDAKRDAKRLSFTLDSPKGLLGYRHKPIGEVALADDPRHFLETKIIDLSMKARKSVKDRETGETESFQQDIAKIGWDLYDQLFPQQLKEEWPKILAKSTPGSLSLLLISDEPWIPWEIVNTPDKDGAFHVDGFLCQQFRMTRWLAGSGLPDQLTLDTVQLVAPERTNLESVKKEKMFFATLSAETPKIRIIKNSLETADQVEQAMSQQLARLYHFACHGEFEPGDPDSSGLLLTGGPFSPSDVVGPTREGIKNSRPMIFLNACSSAEADFGLSRIGGWAQRFVSAGATAFIGSLWEVNDVLAAEFAVAFYRQILAGKALGEAFYQARQIIKKMDPANPTWLAYVLYAHPNGKVEIGA